MLQTCVTKNDSWRSVLISELNSFVTINNNNTPDKLQRKTLTMRFYTPNKVSCETHPDPLNRCRLVWKFISVPTLCKKDDSSTKNGTNLPVANWGHIKQLTRAPNALKLMSLKSINYWFKVSGFKLNLINSTTKSPVPHHAWAIWADRWSLLWRTKCDCLAMWAGAIADALWTGTRQRTRAMPITSWMSWFEQLLDCDY